MTPGEFVLRTLFAEFTVLAEKKIETILSEPLVSLCINIGFYCTGVVDGEISERLEGGIYFWFEWVSEIYTVLAREFCLQLLTLCVVSDLGIIDRSKFI